MPYQIRTLNQHMKQLSIKGAMDLERDARRTMLRKSCLTIYAPTAME
jgi:hypothetical protein